jgi:hypothetical protein
LLTSHTFIADRLRFVALTVGRAAKRKHCSSAPLARQHFAGHFSSLEYRFEVRDQIGGDAADTGFGTDDLFERCPRALQPGLLPLLLVLGKFIDRVVELRQRGFVQRQSGEARLKVDGDGRPIVLRLLHVVNVDVVAEHGTRVAVLARYRGAGEGDEGRIRQGVAQVLGVTYRVACPIRRGGLGGEQCVGGVDGVAGRVPWRPDGPEPGFEAVLGAVRLIGDDHDVVELGMHRVAVLVLAGHEFLDGGEDDAARGAVAEFGAQVLPGVGLYRFLAQQVLRQREDAEQLPVEVVAVGDDDEGRILPQRFLHDARGKAGHGDALAAALRVPDDAALVRAAGARGGDHLSDRRSTAWNWW